MYDERKIKGNVFDAIFVWIISICGFLLVFLTPPLAVPDENTHFINAYSISQLNLLPDINSETGEVGKYIPQYIAAFTQEHKDNYANELDEGYSYAESYFDSWLQVGDDDRELIFWKSDLVSINPWSYVVAALGMKIGSLVCNVTGAGFDTAYNLLLAGRLANLLFYVLISSLAIKITPCLKRTMMLLFSMPISLFLAASVSFDAILIPVAMLLFAEIMKLYMSNEEHCIKRKDICIVVICTLFLTAVKMAYAPLLGLLLLVPFRKYESKKQYITAIIIVMCTGIVGLLIPQIAIKTSIQGAEHITNPNILLQKDYFIHHIYYFPKIMYYTLVKYCNFYISGFIAKIGYLDTNLPIIYVGLFGVILLIVILIESCHISGINWKIKISAVVLSAITIFGMFIAMYTTWTPLVEELYGNTVSGIQGRYFIPVFCFMCTVFFNNIGARMPKNIDKVVCEYVQNSTLFFAIVNSIMTVLFILLRYWCN